MKTQVQERFSEFYDKWLLQDESNLQQLLSVQRDLSHEQEHKSLISKIMNHYKEYYSIKWACVHDDVLGFFSPPWLSPLEIAYLWVTGWKPSMVFKLVHSLRHANIQGITSLSSLSEDQVKKIEQLRLKTHMEEEKVEREMERQQVSMADQKMVELARLGITTTRVRNGEIGREIDGLVNVALKVLLGGLEKLVRSGDCVRLKALKGVLEVLTPLQCVDFLASFLMIQIQLRKLGMKRRNGYSSSK